MNYRTLIAIPLLALALSGCFGPGFEDAFTEFRQEVHESNKQTSEVVLDALEREQAREITPEEYREIAREAYGDRAENLEEALENLGDTLKSEWEAAKVNTADGVKRVGHSLYEILMLALLGGGGVGTLGGALGGTLLTNTVRDRKRRARGEPTGSDPAVFELELEE